MRGDKVAAHVKEAGLFPPRSIQLSIALQLLAAKQEAAMFEATWASFNLQARVMLSQHKRPHVSFVLIFLQLVESVS